MKRLVLFACVLGSSTGCFTFGAMQPASTLGKGNLTGGVESNLNLVAVPNANTARQYGMSQLTPYPSVNGFFRFGVSDHVDLGVRAGGTGIELTSKFMFTNPEDRFVFSIAPSLSGYYLPSITTTVNGQTMSTQNTGTVVLPVQALFGYKLGDHELVVGARVMNQLALLRDTYANAPVVPGFILTLGGSVGFALRLGNSFILMPEIALQAPVFATVSTPFGQASAAGLGIVQLNAGVSCMFGRFKPRSGEVTPQVDPQLDPARPAPAPAPSNPEEWPQDVAPPPPPPPPPPT